LVRRYEKQIAKTIYAILGDCPENDDVGQEVFIRFYKSLHQFRGECRLSTYLTRIAINLALNELKRRRRRHGIFAFTLDQAKDLTHSDENPVESKELHQLFHDAVHSLPEKYRLVIVLRLIDQYSVNETAQVLEIAAGTVMSRLARAQDLLRRKLSPVLGELHE
jgi:RNA polymerase sigma-70 factor, ECF subfamily